MHGILLYFIFKIQDKNQDDLIGKVETSNVDYDFIRNWGVILLSPIKEIKIIFVQLKLVKIYFN